MKCKYCGREDSPKSYMNCAITQVMENEKCCFNCAFWIDLLERNSNNPNWVIINGSSYTFNPTIETGTNSFTRGFAGSKMYCRKLETGEVLASNNVFHQGTVPEHFKSMFPDTAEFITEKEYENETKKS